MTLLDFQQALQQAKTIAQINAVLKAFLHRLGISTFAFTYYAYYPNSQNKLKYDYSSVNFTRWHKHYIDEGYEDIDSTLDIVHQTTLPIFWDVQKQLKEAKTEREKRMRQDSIAFGAEKGLSIPIHGPNEDFAILLLVQMKGENCLENWFEKQSVLFSAAYFYYHYLKCRLLLSKTEHEKEKLSKRDQQCLELIAQMYSIEEMAKALHITERTVNYHIQRLNKKFGTQNKYQTVIKAMKKGLLTL